jgi:hypothetical protein
MVANLEARLGVKLLLRTTRHVGADRRRPGVSRTSAANPRQSRRCRKCRARSRQPARHVAGGAVGGIRNSRSHPPSAWLRGAASETGHRAADVRPDRGLSRRGRRYGPAAGPWALWPIPDSARGCWPRLGASPLPRLPTLRAGECRKRPPTSLGTTALSARVLSGRTGWSFRRSGRGNVRNR